ncbi:MAG: DNA-directed RNA polymerase subunit omega [Planctomycetota bacterium]|nr:MAG: DNA-directed RNA polymerase subunit omega [Planctomycetota bacterium]
MYPELNDESLTDMVGGRFKLSALIQKRLVALIKGAPPLVKLNTNDKMKIVLEEIRQGKIYLDTDSVVQQEEPVPGEEPSELPDFDSL